LLVDLLEKDEGVDVDVEEDEEEATGNPIGM